MKPTLLTLIVVSGLVGFSFQKFQASGMIFSFWGKWMKILASKSFGAKIAKPLGTCIICNTAWIGFIVGYLFTHNILSTIVVGLAAPTIAILINTAHMYLIEQLD